MLRQNLKMCPSSVSGTEFLGVLDVHTHAHFQVLAWSAKTDAVQAEGLMSRRCGVPAGWADFRVGVDVIPPA